MLESEIYAEFLKQVSPLFNVDRMENAIASGMFDCILSAGNRTLWVEFKKTENEKLRGTQVGWVLRRAKHGCETDMIVVTLTPDGFVLVMAVDLARNDFRIKQAPRMLVDRHQLANFLATAFVIKGEDDDDGRGSDQPGTGPTHRSNTRH